METENPLDNSFEFDTDDGDNYTVFCRVSPNFPISDEESFHVVNNYVYLDPSRNRVVRLFQSPTTSVTHREFYTSTQSVLAETLAAMTWPLPEGLLAPVAHWLRDYVHAAGPTGETLVHVAISGPYFDGGDEVVMYYEEETGMVPASRDAIEALEEVDMARVRVRVRASDDDNEVDQCAICLDEFIISDDDDCIKIVVKMPCLHLYHKDCLVRWLEKSNKCPLCRFALPTSQGL